MRQQARLRTTDGELIAEGTCDVGDRPEVTMWPAREAHRLERCEGHLTLEMDSGRVLNLDDRRLVFQLRGPQGETSRVYRLWLQPQASLETHTFN